MSSTEPRYKLPQRAQKHHEEEGGEGNWLVSYADMMTLLVGFFVILLSFSTVDQEKLEQIKKAAASEFGGAYQIPYGDMADRIKAALNKLGLGEQFEVKNNEWGVSVSFYGTIFFESGSASLKPEAQALVQKLIPTIHDEGKEFRIVVEGHTDDTPLSAGALYQSNWELSSVRACRVLQLFEGQGFSKAQLTAVGYADARPAVPNRDQNGQPIIKNQGQNRRVVIKIIRSGESMAPADKPEQGET